MFWKDFKTQESARNAIRKIVDPRPFKEPFESELISDLIVERHYFCSTRKLRPSRFRKLPGGNPYTFQGDFSNCGLDRSIGWHTVSWDKCLRPPKTNWDRIVRAMRDRSEPIKFAYRYSHPVCEACGVLPSEEVHHQAPSFVTLTDAIRALVNEFEITECLSGWNWFAEDNFTLPEEHKITQLFDQHHKQAMLQALCKGCHNLTKKGVIRKR